MNSINLTVTEFNQIMADIIHNQLQLNQLCISGEISQLNYYSKNTHLYLTLIHESASLQCVIYNQHLKKLPVIKKGDQVKIIGQCRFLKNRGQLIFSGVAIQTDGDGNNAMQFAQLFKKLQETGLFLEKRPDQIPRNLDNVCIITSPESAAYHDITTIIQQSRHTFNVMVVPSMVQGLLAPHELMHALTISESLNPDLICISRGGGAESDFACFNDEQLVNFLGSISIPVITGIGHQINTTLCCHTANQQFETPTAMAQFLCTHSMIPFDQCQANLASIKTDISYNIEQILAETNHKIALCNQQINHKMMEFSQWFDDLKSQVIGLNPILKLSNGFVYAETESSQPITSIQQLSKHDTIQLTTNDGSAKAKISHVN